jgi:hypothetical protein
VILSANLGVSLNAPKRVYTYRLITAETTWLKKRKVNPRRIFPGRKIIEIEIQAGHCLIEVDLVILVKCKELLDAILRLGG